VGWVLFFFLFRAESRLDPDAAKRGSTDTELNPETNNP